MTIESPDRALNRSYLIAALAALAWLVLATSGTPRAQPAGAPMLAITAPQPGETIHDNNGLLAVAVLLQGTALAEGRRLRATINDQPYGSDQSMAAFTLHNIDRGEHVLRVQLLDASGSVIATSPSVTFHMWRASAEFPLRKPAPPKK